MSEGQAETRASGFYMPRLEFGSRPQLSSAKLNSFHQPLERKQRASATCQKSMCNCNYYCKISDGEKIKKK